MASPADCGCDCGHPVGYGYGHGHGMAMRCFMSKQETKEKLEQYEDQVVEMISSLDKGDGARWDDVVDYIERKRLSRDVVEEVISNLLDKGLLYEPVLGYLKAV